MMMMFSDRKDQNMMIDDVSLIERSEVAKEDVADKKVKVLKMMLLIERSKC